MKKLNKDDWGLKTLPKKTTMMDVDLMKAFGRNRKGLNPTSDEDI